MFSLSSSTIDVLDTLGMICFGWVFSYTVAKIGTLCIDVYVFPIDIRIKDDRICI